MSDKPKARQLEGLYNKFHVERTDGQSAEGAKHHGCQYFVLDVTHDPFAVEALRAYAEACSKKYPYLAIDLKRLAVDADNKRFFATGHSP